MNTQPPDLESGAGGAECLGNTQWASWFASLVESLPAVSSTLGFHSVRQGARSGGEGARAGREREAGIHNLRHFRSRDHIGCGCLLACFDVHPTTIQKIANALSAAPELITAAATVADLDGTVLRAGTNGFTCMPDDPAIPGNGPICLDAGWQAFIKAWMNQEEPPVPETPAFIYALQGGWPTSNVDPYATGPTEDNEWLGLTDPHIAVLVPDPSMLEGVSPDPLNGGPWIMWGDTP